jgi:hypothetical protein
MKISFLPVPVILMLFVLRCTAQDDTHIHVGVGATALESVDAAEPDLVCFRPSVRAMADLSHVVETLLDRWARKALSRRRNWIDLTTSSAMQDN